MDTLSKEGYVIIPNFLSPDLVSSLCADVTSLRSRQDVFKVARIGQDSTNTLNTDIRVAETCFIGPAKLQNYSNRARTQLYDILETVRADLSANSKFDKCDENTGELIQCAPALDSSLNELLYAYYPEGGFYRRHRDALPGSASVLRCYSLLLYINTNENNSVDWDMSTKGGALRMHLDSGGDFLPEDEEPNFIDVAPSGGTLVLFRSDKIPHEVLDTRASRMAVVGWYNRAVTAGDISNLSGQGSSVTRSLMLAIAAALVTAGVAVIVMGG